VWVAESGDNSEACAGVEDAFEDATYLKERVGKFKEKNVDGVPRRRPNKKPPIPPTTIAKALGILLLSCSMNSIDSARET